MNKIRTFIAENKGITIVIVLILIMPLAVWGFTKVYTPTDRAVTDGQAVVEEQNKEIEEVVNSVNKKIDFRIPMSEEIIESILKQESIDGKMDFDKKLTFIENKFGNEVKLLAEMGQLPSKLLTKTQNQVILDNINTSVGITDGIDNPNWTINTYDYIFSSGEDAIYTLSNHIVLDNGYTIYNAEGKDTWLEVGDLIVGGINVNHISETPVSGINTDNFSYFESHGITDTSDLTVITYYVTTKDKSFKGKDLFDKLNDLTLSVNGNDVLNVQKGFEYEGSISEYILGESAYLTDSSDEMPNSSFFPVTRYVKGNVIKDGQNTVTINGNTFDLTDSKGFIVHFGNAK